MCAGGKRRKLPIVHMKEYPENVTKLVTELDNNDGMLLAFVTESPLLKISHVHVFGMKREQDGRDIAKSMTSLCKLEGEKGRWSKCADASKHRWSRYENGDEIHSAVGESKTVVVKYIGDAYIGDENWWKRSAKIVGVKHILKKPTVNDINDRLEKFFSQIILKPELLTDMESEVLQNDVALVVNSDNAAVYSLLTQEAIRTISTGDIRSVRSRKLPPRVLDVLSPREINDSDSAAKLLSHDQHTAVQEYVDSGDIDMQAALSIAVEVENKLRRDMAMKMIWVSHLDANKVGVVISGFLVRGDKAMSMVKDAITTARKNARLATVDPFAPIRVAIHRRRRRSVRDFLLATELDRNALMPVEHLGAGAFGEVYLANHMVLFW